METRAKARDYISELPPRSPNTVDPCCSLTIGRTALILPINLDLIYERTKMPQYVIEREIPNAGQMSESEIREVSIKSLQVLGEMGPKIRWLHSYVTENKIYCVYVAADEAAIREHAQRGGFPANRISKVRKLIDPVNYE